jgi:hypothetical protein
MRLNDRLKKIANKANKEKEGKIDDIIATCMLCAKEGKYVYKTESPITFGQAARLRAEGFRVDQYGKTTWIYWE